jgi:hypothetical protein
MVLNGLHGDCAVSLLKYRKEVVFWAKFCVLAQGLQTPKKTRTMKAFVRIGLVAALCVTGTAVYGQEPVINRSKAAKPKVQTEAPTARTTSPKQKPAKKSAPVSATRAKKVEPAKKIDFAPAK